MSVPTWDHLILAPILVPLLAGALLSLIDERRHGLKLAINALATVGTLLVAMLLLWRVDSGHWPDHIGVYMAANWVAPYGIALVVDRLSALLLLLSATLSTAALLFSVSRWSRVGVHFHSLFQFLQMGLSGAFLTGDLFNLFVFFEVMLAASYGLLLHGYNATRLKAGMQYIVINLVASLFFLIGIALVYAGTGTLNFADLARVAGELATSDRQLLEIGATTLCLAFLVKSAAWPLGFWLPGSYAAAPAPTAALMALMTKVGVYAIFRLWFLVFPPEAGGPPEWGSLVLFGWGLATIGFGALGVLAQHQTLSRMAGYCAVVSSGTLIAAMSLGQSGVVGAALFYLASSTLGLAALLLLAELIERMRTPAAAMIALTMEAFAIDMPPEEDTLKSAPGRPVPGSLAFLGFGFMACAIIISGLPPLSGFMAKFSLFHAALATDSGLNPEIVLTLMAVMFVAGFVSLIALMRFGVRALWANGDVPPPMLRISEAAPVAVLLAACMGLTVAAGPAMAYMQRTADQLAAPAVYTERVLTHAVIPGPTTQAVTP